MRFVATVLATCLLASLAAAQCARTHPFVGFTGRLTTRADSLGGTVTILDDCSFLVAGKCSPFLNRSPCVSLLPVRADAWTHLLTSLYRPQA
jgi:hypothetical protein